MTLAVYLAVTFGFAAGAWIIRDREPGSTIVGLVGLLAATIAAVAIDPAETIARWRRGAGHERPTCGSSWCSDRSSDSG